jgi:uncharacterized protein YecE (DUF72 family)
MYGLRIGTCSWNFDSWVGLVYSEKQRTAAGYLAEYAQYFNTAEVDSWFYRIPDRASVMEYRAAVPESFRFTCKVPQEITLTHHRQKKKSDPLEPNESFLSVERFEQFIRAIEPLLPQMDAVMLEFEYLNKQKMRGLDAFLESLDRFLSAAPSGIPYAVEPRNHQYVTDRYFRFLLERNVAHVFSEKIYMPHVWELYRTHQSLLSQMDRAVVRLMGGDRKEIEELTGRQWNQVVLPKDPDKEHITGMVSSLVSHAYTTLNVNNHYEGAAPTTIRSIRNLLHNQGVHEQPMGEGHRTDGPEDGSSDSSDNGSDDGGEVSREGSP